MLATRSSNTLPPSEGVKACTLSGNWAWSNSWLDRDLKARGCANPLVPSGPVGLRITSILKQKAKTDEVPLNIFLVKMQLTVDAGDYSLSLNPIFLKYCTCRYMFGPLFRHCTSVFYMKQPDSEDDFHSDCPNVTSTTPKQRSFSGLY